MKIQRGYKFRFYPTLAQRRQLAREFGASRYVYNRVLREQETAWREYCKALSVPYYCPKPKLSPVEWSRRVTLWKKSMPWLKNPSATVLVNATYDLESAYQGYFKHDRGKPKFKRRFAGSQSVTYQFDKRHPERCINGQRLSLPKLGECKLVWSQEVPSLPESVTVTRHSTGRWTVTLNAVKTSIDALPWTNQSVGIDMGLQSIVALDCGLKLKTPQHFKASKRRLTHYERMMSRRIGARKGEKKSERWKRARTHVARQHEHVRQERAEALHVLSTAIVRENQAIAIEDLHVRGMARRRSTAPALANAGLGELRRQLTYKAQWYGRDLHVIGRFVRSTGVCPDCSTVGPKLALSVRDWTCQDCDVHHDRDIAAARVIKMLAGLPVGSREFRLVDGYNKLGGVWAKARIWQPEPNEARTAQRALRQDVAA